MAKVLGSAGRYTESEYNKKDQELIRSAILIATINGMFMGITILLSIMGKIFFAFISITISIIFLFFVFQSSKKLLKFREEILKYAKGTYGERHIATILEKLPDEYYVLHGLKTEAGDIDHVVVGPTGVFLIDTKNWRGTVTSENGELLINGKTTSKKEISQMLGKTMGIKDKITILTKLNDAYFQAIMVFPMAKIYAPWKTTKQVHCITDKQLIEYIKEKNDNKVLKENKDLVQQYAEAFSAIARMDNAFDH